MESLEKWKIKTINLQIKTNKKNQKSLKWKELKEDNKYVKINDQKI